MKRLYRQHTNRMISNKFKATKKEDKVEETRPRLQPQRVKTIVAQVKINNTDGKISISVITSSLLSNAVRKVREVP